MTTIRIYFDKISNKLFTEIMNNGNTVKVVGTDYFDQPINIEKTFWTKKRLTLEIIATYDIAGECKEVFNKYLVTTANI